MTTLKQLIRDLQQQLTQVCAQAAESRETEPRLIPTRVSLSLRIRVSPVGLEVVPTPADKADGQPAQAPESIRSDDRMTIEFQVETPVQGGIPRAMEPRGIMDPPIDHTALPQAPARTEDQRLPLLEQVLGSPGFDSAARASVFREALEGLAESQRITIWEVLKDTTPGNPVDPELKHARHLLRGVLRSGPAGLTSSVLDRLRQEVRSNGSHSLLELLRRHWKSQEDWL